MASIIMKRGTTSEISNTPISDGQILFERDTKNIYIDEGSNRTKYRALTVDIDNTLSTTSVNPVQNKVITNKVNNLESRVDDILGYYTDDDIYGVEVDFKNKKFTRLAGAVEKTPGESFDSVKAFGGRKRCNVDNSGNVIAYYGDAGFSTTGKLTQAVTVGEGGAAVTYASGTIVQVMVEQPKFYYKVVPLLVEKKAKGSITRKIRYYVSDTAKAGFKLHPAFIVNGQENEKIYVSAFEGSLWDASASTYILDDSQVADFTADMLSSIANAKPISGLTQDLTRAKTRLLAQNRGTGWEQATVQTATASELLMLIEYASFNMQSAIGRGVVNKIDDGKTNMAENTGATITLGNASGAVLNGNAIQIVSYRGEENFWGSIWGWVDGINIYNYNEGSVHIADHGFVDNSKADPYKDAGITIAGANGYVSAFAYNEDFDWLFIAGEVLGNSSLPVGDNFYQSKAASAYTVAVLGGHWDIGSSAGGFCWSVGNVSSGRYRNIGGRLVYRKKVA
jgi:hypothetical protein